ncbi:glucose 1-dehydrogenase [Amycolatopsis mediterranei]|uniref:Short-chain dehydrogenase n=1 Tax=Amycolatopsis mediterranei (strain U-32) TaxID=749927 RepID=A0A0H3D2P8_AMYMU|nr:glucose 1-dehydrogenase [Amycolatopsis mediterranei]ADJ43756.1 short-chain dehydrogenase [Amycolatopsis mediterranei U32]KDO08406.1 short-chain dehydrogenase [Amycolatopsis mediterranei]KDU85486.1 short-chain dehydrogenase [Amycolatopsis mediterranei]UZF68960.1 glucose 1-dehydrogenase [Amycolatopsis mediterranei]
MGARFAGKVVLVTGGGSGIGRATARAFADEGATVVVAGRDERRLASAVAEIGGGASAVTVDVTDSADVARMVATVVARHGRLDVAFNNAGILGSPAAAADLGEDDFGAVMGTNVTGTWLCLKHEVAHMRAHGGGAIVNMASNIGAHGRLPNMAAYAASKAAVSVLTRTAARDHIADGIRINAVSPGATDTDMSRRPGETDAGRAERLKNAIPLGRVGATAEVAAAVLWLASDEAAFTVGHDLVVDGGATA